MSQEIEIGFKDLHWAGAIKEDDGYAYESMGSSSSISDDELDDHASSSCGGGPLYELNQLMAQLPFKRGLSKFYNGKSKTFGSLGHVKTLEDLGKDCCRSNSSGRMEYKFGPNATIAKRSPKSKRLFRPSLLEQRIDD